MVKEFDFEISTSQIDKSKIKEKLIENKSSLEKEKNTIDKNLSNNEKKEVAEIISKIKSKVSIMNEENKKKSIKYIQNLTKITKMYFSFV